MKKILIPVTIKNRLGKDETVLMLRDRPYELCKTCKKDVRRNGSAFCQGCANKHFKDLLK